MLKIRESIEKRKKQYDEMIASATSHTVGLKLLRDKNRWLCRNDLFHLCCVLNYKEIQKFEAFYRPFCDEVSLICWQIVRKKMYKPSEDMLTLEEVSDNVEEDLKYIERLYLCYRVFYKTTIITIANSTQLLLNFPDLHIVLCHNKQDNSSDNLIAIKNHFLTTRLKNYFSEYIPKTKEWGNRTGFSVACRSDWQRVEDNVEAAGVDTEITGRHYDIAKKNDLVTEKSVTTEEQIKKTLSWDERFNIGMFTNLSAKIQDYEGTRYHFADMYSVKKGTPRIKLVEIPILEDVEKFKAGDDNQIVHPQRFKREDIEQMMSDMWVFNCQMMQKPEDPAKMRFHPNMIQYGKTPSHSNKYLLVDPASERKKKSDYTVILVVAIDSNGKKYIVDGIRDKIDPKQRIDEALDLAERWSVKGVAWEAIGFQTTDCFYFEEARRKRNLHFSFDEIKSHTVSKNDRISGLVPEYAQHLWYWPPKDTIIRQSSFDGKAYDLTKELEIEFLQFPLCEHDDLLDTQTFLNRISTIKPEKEKEEIEEKEMTFAEYHAIKEKRTEELKKDPWKAVTVTKRT